MTMTTRLADEYGEDSPPVKYGRCECGVETCLTDQRGNDFTCTCGRDYNCFGQELRPRDQWEENMEEDY